MQAAGAEPFAVAGAGAHDQGETARSCRFDETLLERGVQRFRNAALDKPCRRDNGTFANSRDGLIGRNDFVGKHAMRFPGHSLGFGGVSTGPCKCRAVVCFMPDTIVSAGPAFAHSLARLGVHHSRG